MTQQPKKYTEFFFEIIGGRKCAAGIAKSP